LQDGLLNDAGVAVISGTSFGVHGEGYLRFSYAASIEAIETAMDRIANFLRHHAA
jgi:aspartate/methionine/tyrosine aminotransferase